METAGQVQWRSHWGVKGAECHPDREKFAKKLEKSGKMRKNR